MTWKSCLHCYGVYACRGGSSVWKRSKTAHLVRDYLGKGAVGSFVSKDPVIEAVLGEMMSQETVLNPFPLFAMHAHLPGFAEKLLDSAVM